jgi:uncharacterized surface protein with fasciclin (FAS1) repeats
MKKLVYLFLAMLMVGAAVKAAGLVETLQSPGPFTVFAPSNEAFAKLPTGAVDALFKPEECPARIFGEPSRPATAPTL